MLFQRFLQVSILSFALADLQCKDLILHNWTTPNVRLHVEDLPGLDNTYNTTPAFLLANNPFKLAPKSSQGSVFKLRTCNSTSLGLQASYGCFEDGEGESWQQSFMDYIQIINPATGHCLTQNPPVKNYSTMSFIPCNPNPKNASQLFHSEHDNSCSQDCCTNPRNVDGYGTQVRIDPSFGTANKASDAEWSLQADPKHIIMEVTYNFTLNVVGNHIELILGYNADPLRT